MKMTFTAQRKKRNNNAQKHIIPLIHIKLICKYYFTASLSALPGLKAGTLLAAMSMSSPV